MVIKHWTWSDLFTLFLPLFFPLVPPWSFSFNSYVPSAEQPITSLLIFFFFSPKTSLKLSPSSKSLKSWAPVGTNALSLHELISAELSCWVSHQEQSNLLPFMVLWAASSVCSTPPWSGSFASFTYHCSLDGWQVLAFNSVSLLSDAVIAVKFYKQIIWRTAACLSTEECR